jgi:glycosyltransferase involved in cell wall biosynthesis
VIDPQAPDFSDTPTASSRPRYAYRPRRGRVERPGASIVTVFDDAAGVFHETARCVLDQSFQHWEWLIVDAGSTDAGARATLGTYRDLDPRIRVIDLPSQRGRGAARNAGGLAARAPYVFILDGGDLIEPTALEKSLWHLATHPEFAFANGFTVRLGPEPSLSCRSFEGHEGFLDERPVAGPCLVRRSTHAEVGGFDETLGGGLEGWDYWLRHADRGLWGSTIPEYLAWHRGRAERPDDAGQVQEFRERARRRYPHLFERGVPRRPRRPPAPYEPVRADAVLDNPLERGAGVRRALLIFPRLIVGGADKFTIDLVAQLAARGHEVTLCTTLESDHAWLAQVTRVTPDVFPLATFLRLPDYPRFLLYLIESRRIDVVIVSHSYLGYQLLPFLRAHRPEVACVDYSHIEAEEWNNGGYPRAAVGCQELLDLTLVSTRHLKEWMVARGAQASRIEVVHTNIDTEVWKPSPGRAAAVRSEFGFPPEWPLILYAGRLEARKQPHVFAEVVRRLAEEGQRSFACLVAGDGDELPALRRFLADHGLGTRVQLLGWVGMERMRELQAAADIFFLPSRLEGLSLALFEAMAMETVPVSARVGGQDELVTADCGVLVAPGDGEIERYVEALRQLIDSPALRAAMGAAARRRVVESFSLDQMGERMCEALSRAAKLCLAEPRRTVSTALGLESATLAVEYARLEASADQLARANEELAARAEGLQRQLTSAHLGAERLTAADAVKRLSAGEISRHIGARKIFATLCRRLAWRAGLVREPRPDGGG